MGLPRFRLKQVAEAFGISSAKFLDQLPRLIRGIVVDYQYFPLDGSRQRAQRNAVQRP